MGDIRYPRLPDEKELKRALSVAYLASMETEEGRPIRFKMCLEPICLEASSDMLAGAFQVWEFQDERPLTVSEIRRLAPAVSYERGMIWVTFSENDQSEGTMAIRGVVNIGKNWEEMRAAISYKEPKVPYLLNLDVHSPGAIRIYQGDRLIVELQQGELVSRHGVHQLPYQLNRTFRPGLKKIESEIQWPKIELGKDASEFNLLAHRNVFFGLVNLIQLRGDGGTMVVLPPGSENVPSQSVLPLKYGFCPPQETLRLKFIDVLTARHKFMDLVELHDLSGVNPEFISPDVADAQRSLDKCFDGLRSAMDLVADFARVDGALLLSSDLRTYGFGGEIKTELLGHVDAKRISCPKQYLRSLGEPSSFQEFDVESVGMRHRSALRLCGGEQNLTCFVISHDGPVSAIWREGETVYIDRGFRATHQNYPLA